MKKFYFGLCVALATFLVGIAAAGLYFRRAETAPPARVGAGAPTRPASPPPLAPPPCPPFTPSKKKLDADEAVRVAECFVIKNGYTDLPSSEDKSEITPEAVWPMTDEYGMELRRDSLTRPALGYVKMSGGWLVVFRGKYKERYARAVPDYEERLKTMGRAVSMDAYGGRVRMEHQNVDLASPGLTKLSDGIQTDGGRR